MEQNTRELLAAEESLSTITMEDPRRLQEEQRVRKVRERQQAQGSEDDRVEMLHKLLWKKADVNAKSVCGSTPLFFAARDGLHKIVETLLKVSDCHGV